MEIRFLFVLLGTLGVLAGAGCGSAAERGSEERAVAPEELISDFGAQPGELSLRRFGGTDGKFEQLGIGLDPPPAALRRYGIFSIYVVEPGEKDARAALLTDKTTGAPLEPDERGIYWEYDDHSKTWIANTTYGENVVLVWFSEKPERETDIRWERLHEFLTESTAA
ncbi:MAG: hypothetical protein KY396_01970 [Actinobacteria bacterium]|nr:hypothetical protein [Actinomycetota bacterium]